MLKFRGHHLICLHFFQGEGYSEEYVENLRNVLERADKKEEIEVVEGPDDICRACPSLKEDRCNHKNGADLEISNLDNIAIKFLGVAKGEKVIWSNIKNKIKLAPKEWLAAFCEGCDWENVCNRTR